MKLQKSEVSGIQIMRDLETGAALAYYPDHGVYGYDPLTRRYQYRLNGGVPGSVYLPAGLTPAEFFTAMLERMAASLPAAPASRQS